MILAAWSHSLEYSIGTSSHGMNVMTAICEKLGFLIDYIFRQLPTKTADELSGNPMLAQSFELDSFMSEVKGKAAGGEALATGSDGCGAKKSTLKSYEERMRNSRILRNDFRRKAADKAQEAQPIQSIAAVVGKESAAKYQDALFPTAVSASMYYKPPTLLQWATGKRVNSADATGCGGALHFKERETDGGAKVFDFGWLVLYNTGSADRTPTWQNLTKDKICNAPMVSLFDMHVQGVADAMFMLASTENSQLLAEQPRLPWSCRGSNAFLDQDNNRPGKNTVSIGLRPVQLAGVAAEVPAHEGDAVGTRLSSSVNHHSKTPLHKQLDLMHQRCRLPSLQPHSSTKVIRAPPIRRSGGTIEVNSVAAFEHVSMFMEGILRCSHVAGLKGVQERFQSGGSAPNCLKAPNVCTALQAAELRNTVRCLPFSIDLMQMAWTLDLANRLYTPTRNHVRMSFNTMVQNDGLGDLIGVDSMPELTLRYPGFPMSTAEKTEALRLISIKTHLTRPVNQKEVEISSASPLQELDPELLRYETEVAIGGKASDADIEEHRRSLIGTGYVYGVTGDVFSYETWADHLSASMIGRGNTDGAVDECGRFTDKAHVSMLDAEFMFEARLVERQCLAGVNGYQNLGLVLPSGSTYNYLEANPPRVPQAGQKRVRLPEPPRVRASAAARLANQYAVTPRVGAPGTSSEEQRITLRQGDSRSDDY